MFTNLQLCSRASRVGPVSRAGWSTRKGPPGPFEVVLCQIAHVEASPARGQQDGMPGAHTRASDHPTSRGSAAPACITFQVGSGLVAPNHSCCTPEASTHVAGGAQGIRSRGRGLKTRVSSHSADFFRCLSQGNTHPF